MALDRRTRRLDGGAALLGLSPGRLLHLAPAARRLLDAGDDLVVRDATSAQLARRLLDGGIAHPVVTGRVVPSGPASAEVSVVIPVRDRPAGLRRLLDALAPGAPAEVIVVDDGSADPAGCRAAAEGSALGDRVRLVRHPRSRGPAAARNTGAAAARSELVAFLDSDVVPGPGWLAPLLAHLADPAVALAAPRITALPPSDRPPGWLDRYERLRSSLDLGPEPGPIVPRTRVAYVPSAALLVRRAALGTGFDEELRVAEDVDLVLRLHAAGWRLRYEPAASVAHEHRARPVDWWTRKAFYGTGAAALALRHPGSVPPMVLAPWAGAVCVLVGVQRRSGLIAAGAVTGVAWWRVRRTLAPAGGTGARLRRPGRVAALLVGLGLASAASQSAGLLVRHWWPVAAVGCLRSRRMRRAVLVAAVAEGLLDWRRHRPPVPDQHPDHSHDEQGHVEPGLDPVRYVLAHRADDLGYGAGLWWGALRRRTLAPLRPLITGLGGRSVRARAGEKVHGWLR